MNAEVKIHKIKGSFYDSDLHYIYIVVALILIGFINFFLIKRKEKIKTKEWNNVRQ